MKLLILSFFAVILGYSLFVDKKEESKSSHSERATPVTPQTVYTIQPLDSVPFYATPSVKIF